MRLGILRSNRNFIVRKLKKTGLLSLGFFMGIMLFGLRSISQPVFVNGSPQSFTACNDGSAISIDPLLTVNEGTGFTLTWTVTSNPTHGSMGGFPTTAASGTGVSPTGTTYTPSSGYSGTDAFTIQVSDGTSTATTTVNVTVNPAPANITGPRSVCVGSTINLVQTTSGGTWSSSATGVATVGSLTGTVAGVSTGTATISYTMSSGCFKTTTVTVNTNPSAAYTASPNPVCLGGGAVTFTSGAPLCSGNALSFNGSNSNAALGSVITTATNNITLEAWVNWSGATGAYQFIALNGNSSSSGYALLVPPGGSGNLQVLLGGVTFCISGASLTAGTWQHVAMVRNSGTWSVYLNGTQFAVSNATTSPATPAGAFIVGNNLIATEGFNGDIDEVRFWSVARTTTQIQADMNACNTAPQSNLLGYWKFNEGAGSTAFDASGNANDLALSNTSWVSAGETLSTFSWSFGDGATATTDAVAHTYTASGSYSSSLVVTNAAGCTATSSATVTINPLPAITGNLNVCLGATTTLSGSIGGGSWSSSSPGTASVSGSGVVTGNGVGTATITYTLATGCLSTKDVTVNPNPAAIGGTFTVCPGLTTTLTDGTGGGTWSSSNAAKASVVAGTGVVTGVSAGTAYITYTLATGCKATQQITVNPLPAAISGNLNVCLGATTTLTDASSGGSWSSSAPGTASVSGGGVVTGIGLGTATISYTLPTGCYITADVTVNPNPTAITGTLSVCTGQTTALGSTPGGGAWTSSDITKATVGGGTGVVSGVAAGTPTITYTLPTGCTVTAAVTVNQTPAAITGSTQVCEGSSITLSDATAGGTWSSSAPGTASVVAGTGVVTGVAAGTADITYTMPSGCFNLVTITVNPNPAAIGGTANACVGQSSTLTDGTPSGLWSSSTNAIATVGSTTGTVTGVSAGTATITYTLPTGCIATTSFIVNPIPAAITGPSSVCEGQSITLADATTGGTWSTSNPAQATVGGGSGVVTGVTASTPTITYTLPAGCFATMGITVNPSPAAITGANTVCIGLTTTLSDATGGGTWSSSDPSQATVNGTGDVTGVAIGTPTITYTLPAGCFAIQPMTVNPIPAAISGTFTVCQGATTSLSDITGGGTWSSSNVGEATVGASSGIVTGVAAGTPVITYTLAAGCIATQQITVNAAPDISNFTSPTSLNTCLGNGLTVNVNSTSLGTANFTVTYNLSGANASTGNTATLSMGASTGTFTVPSSQLSSTGATTVTITGITNALGCNSYPSTSNTLTFTVNPVPTAYTVSGTGGYCAGGSGIHVMLSNSVGGVDYQLYLGGVATGSPVTGTFSALDMGAQTAAGTYTIIATNSTTTCTANMTGSAIITVNPLPTAFAVTGGGSYCAGGSGVAIGVANSQNGVNYQLYLSGSPSGSPVAGNGGAISFGNRTSGGTYTVVATNATTACTNNMTGSATVIVNPLPAAITGTLAVCVNSTTTLADATAGGTWSSVNTAVGTVGAATGVVTGLSAGTSVISYTLGTGCAATATVTVNPLPAAIAGAGTVCVGNTLSLTDPTGSGTWTSSNSLEASVGSASGIVAGVSAGTPTITYTLPTGCIATAGVTVNNTPLPITGSTAVCVGATTTLNDVTSGGSWSSSNGSVATVGAGTGVVTGGSAGSVSISYTVNGCSVSYAMTVNPLPSAISGAGNVCVGATTTLTDATSGGVWTSSNPAEATVGSTTGLVSGVAAGTPTISYTIGTGCFVTKGITVNTTPSTINSSVAGSLAIISTIAGNGSLGFGGDGGPATSATLNNVTGIVVDPAGNIYFSDYNNKRVRKINTTGVVTTVAGTGVGGFSGDGGPATAATIGNPWGLALDASGNLYIGDYQNARVRRVSTSGIITTIAGTGTAGYNGDGIAATAAQLNTPSGLAFDAAGNLYIADNSEFRVRKVNTSGIITTFAGTGVASSTGDGGAATAATFQFPIGVMTDPSGKVYISDYPSNNIRVVNTSGIISRFAGTGSNGNTGDGGPATAATFFQIYNTAIDANGNVYIPDYLNNRVRVVAGGIVNAFAGTGTPGFSGDGGSALAATLNNPVYVATDAAGNVYIADFANSRIRKVVRTSALCLGSTLALSDVTSGGTWSSSNPAIASVGSASGIVTGASVGAATISYIMPTGCFNTISVTVNPVPASISGSSQVCVGSTTTLSNATTGGAWSSSNNTIATIASTGTVTGVAAGPVTISYTTPSGCTATLAMTVNALPAAITGSSTVCTGVSTTLNDVSAGGTWSSSNGSLATVGSASGVVTGVGSGTPNITYTLPTGCIATKPMTVNPSPATITGATTVCTGLTTTLADASSGGTWSSSDLTKAIVGSASGTVTGVAAGTVNISYSFATGCFQVQAMTVNLQPAAITGPNNVCTGSTITLADGTAGGTWTSGNPTAATVGSASGAVSGTTPGVTTISYTLPGGCSATAPVTVNLQPVAVTAPANAVCVSSTITLSDATSGGLWSSSNPATASVGSGTGVVTGLVAGTVNISYTLPGGCSSIAPVTVNPLPTAITGTPVVCVNATTTLTDGTSGGVWTSSNTGVATIGSSSGVVTGVTAGTANFTYTVPTSCIATIAGTVNALPGNFSVNGGGAYCSGGSGVHVGLAGSATGIAYQLNNGGPVGSALPGTGSALDFGLKTTSGTYTVVATNTVTACSVQMSGSALVTINANPTAFTVTGGGPYCSGGTGVNIGLSNSSANVRYKLLIGGVPSGTSVLGNNGVLTFGLRTAAGVYTATGIDTLTGCTSTMTGIATVVINALPTAYTVTGGGSYCTGGTGVAVGLSNSDAGTNYQLVVNGTPGTTLAGTGAALTFGSQTTAGSYTVVATNTVTACSNNMSGTVGVSVNALPATFPISSGGSYCVGSTGVTVTQLGSATGVNYQLFYGSLALGSPVAGTGGNLTFGPLTGVGTYSVVATSTITTCTNAMTGTATVTTNPLPAVYNVSGGGAYCVGSTAPTIILSNSDVGTTYRLILSATTVTTVTATGGTGTALTFSAPNTSAAGTYTIVATSGVGCPNTMSGSAAVFVNPLPTPYAVTGGGAYCAGGTGVNVGLASSNTGINYQLYANGSITGSPVAGTGAAISFGSQTAPGTYTVVAINATTMCTVNMTSSATVSINTLPTVFNVTGGGSYCPGGTGVHIGLNGSVSGTTYQLFTGGLPVTGASILSAGGALDFGLITTAGTYTVTATAGATSCANAMAGSAVVVINPLPAVNTVTGGGSYCSGGTGVSIGLNGSVTTSTYQLYNGTVASGLPLTGTGSSLNFGPRTTPGTYTVKATDLSTGCSNTMSGSAVVSVNPLPASFNVTGGGAYCTGGTGVHVGLNGSSTGVSYQLKLSGSSIGSPVTGTGSALDFGLQTLAGNYTVAATDVLTGCTNNMSGTVNVAINSLPAVYTVTTMGSNHYCIGGTGVDIQLTGSANNISYQLYNAGTPVGAAMTGTGAAIDFGLQTGAGAYTVVATDMTTMCTKNMTGTATVVIDPLPAAYLVTGGGSYCDGGTGVNVGLAGSGAGVDYQLYNGTLTTGTPVAGTGSAISFGSQLIAGSYTVMATDATSGCINTMTGAVNVSIDTLPTVFDVTGGGNYCSGGTGRSVGLSSSTSGINYQLYNGSTATGGALAGTGSMLDFGIMTSAGIYSVIATSITTGCHDTMSGNATISIDPLPTVHALTGGGSYCIGGAGLSVGISASDVGISYQLIKGTTMLGGPIGGTGFPLDFGLQSAGLYTVIATNMTTGCSQTMGAAVSITTNPLPTAFNITGGGRYCASGAGLHIGTSGSSFGVNYQLYNSGVAVGSPMAGTGSALDFGAITAAGSYTITGTNVSTGCVNTMTGTASVTVDPLPLVYSVTGGGNFCPGGTGALVGLSGSNSGINYGLYRGTTLVATMPGTDSTLNFGLQTNAGTYTVIATDPASACARNMTGSAAVIVNTLPTVFNVTGGGSYCTGGFGLHVYLSGSNSGVNYQLYMGGAPAGLPVAGTGGAIDLGVHVFAGNYTVVATNATTGCTANMTGSAIIAINPLPNNYPLTGGGSYCAGDSGLHITLAGSDAGISYQLKRGSALVGTPVTGTGSALDFGPLTAAGSYSIAARNVFTTCSSSMRDTVTIAVNALPLTYSVYGGGSYCAGGVGAHVNTTGSETGVNYQLYKDGLPTGTLMIGSGASIDFGMQTAAGTYTVVAINAATGCTRTMAGSATIIVNALPNAYSVTGGGNYCAGSGGVHIGLAGSNSGVTYRLYNTGGPVGTAVAGAGGVVDFGLITGADTYTVTATNIATGCTNSMTGSATIGINPVPAPIPVTGGGNYCSGTAGANIGLSGSVSGVNYQLYNGTMPMGSTVAGTGSAISFGPQTLAGTYTVTGIDAATGCTSNMTGSTTVTMIPSVTPSVTIGTGVGDTVCAGATVTFSPLATNGGTTPAYIWKVNGTTVGTSGSYTYIPVNGDNVSVTMTSSAACASPATVNGSVIMTVLTNQVPTVTITAHPGDTVCQGTRAAFTVATAWGGATPTFSWNLNGSVVAAGSTYSYIPADNDVLFVTMNSSYQCVTTADAVSNNITMRVQNTSAPVVTVSYTTGSVLNGVAYNDTFTASVANGGFNPQYQWSVNGAPVAGATNAVYMEHNLNVNDVVMCLVVNSNACGIQYASSSVTIIGNNVGVVPVSLAGSDIRLVPNPNKGTFTLQGSLGTSRDEEVAVEITDMLGQVIWRNSVIARNGELKERISITHVANGMYLLNLRSGSDTRVFHMVVEQ